PAYLAEELDPVSLFVEKYNFYYRDNATVPFYFNDTQHHFRLAGFPDDIKSFTWELRSPDGVVYDNVTSEDSSYTLDLYAVSDEFFASGNILELVVYYGEKTFKMNLEFTFLPVLTLSNILRLPYNEMLEHLLTWEEDALKEIAKDFQHINSLQDRLNNYEFGSLVGLLMLEIPKEINEKEAIKLQAMKVLGVILSNKSVARSLLDKKLKVVIIPRNKNLTDVESF